MMSTMNPASNEKVEINTGTVNITTIFPDLKEDLMEESAQYIDVKTIKSP